MSMFTDELEVLIGDRFGNKNKFAVITGAKTSYLTEIFKHRKFPKPQTLREWLEKAGIEEETTSRLVFLLRLERLRTDEDLSPLCAYFDDRIEQLQSALIRISKVCFKAGVKLPGEVVQLVEALEASRE